MNSKLVSKASMTLFEIIAMGIAGISLHRILHYSNHLLNFCWCTHNIIKFKWVKKDENAIPMNKDAKPIKTKRICPFYCPPTLNLFNNLFPTKKLRDILNSLLPQLLSHLCILNWIHELLIILFLFQYSSFWNLLFFPFS